MIHRLSEDPNAYKLYVMTDLTQYYIGQTRQLISERFSCHKSAASSWKSRVTPIVRAMRPNLSQWTICEVMVYDEQSYILQVESALIELFRMRGHSVVNTQCVDYDDEYYLKASEVYHEYATRQIMEADELGVEPSLYFLNTQKLIRG